MMPVGHGPIQRTRRSRVSSGMGEPEAAIVLTVHAEGGAQLAWCLGRIRRAHPEMPVVVVSDGVPDPGHPACCEAHGVEFVVGERLKVPDRGAAWWSRFFAVGLDAARRSGARRLLKLDPDTSVNRPISSWPAADFSGSVLREPHRPALVHVQGGCQAFSLAFADRVLASGVCGDPAYADPATWCPVPAAAERCRRDRYLSTDWTMVHIARRVGAAWADWPEVCCRWRPWPGVLNARWAVTHPYRVGADTG